MSDDTEVECENCGEIVRMADAVFVVTHRATRYQPEEGAWACAECDPDNFEPDYESMAESRMFGRYGED